MFIAVASNSVVLEVATSEAASLEGMAAYARMGYRKLSRVETDEAAFRMFSGGKPLKLDMEVVDCKPRTIVVRA